MTLPFELEVLDPLDFSQHFEEKKVKALTLDPPLPYQKDPLDELVRNKLLCWGRRRGKTVADLHAGLFGHGKVGSSTKYPGVMQGWDVIWLAQDYPNLLRTVWDGELAPFEGHPQVEMNQVEHRFTVKGKGSLYLVSAEAVSGVRGMGKKLGGVILDEAAHWDTETAWKQVLVPALADNEGWSIWSSTTNRGEDGHPEKRIPSFFNQLVSRVAAIQTEGKRAKDWRVWFGDAQENPKISAEAFATMIEELGGEGSQDVDQEVYARVLTPGSGESLIRWEWCQASAVRVEPPVLPNVKPSVMSMGVDAAQSKDGDQAAFCVMKGSVVTLLEAKACPDATQLGTEAYQMQQAAQISPWHVGVDPVGVGAATANEMRRLNGRPIRELGGALKCVTKMERAEDGSSLEWVPDANRFQNLRAQMAWQLREDIRLCRITITVDQTVWGELCAVRYQGDGEKVRLEPKEKTKARLGHSPNRMDALMYCNWVRPRAKEVVEVEEWAAWSPEALQADYEASWSVRGRKDRMKRDTEVLDPDFGEF